MKVKLILFLFISLMFAPSASAIMINEIMYDPPSSLGGTYAEWIELYNDESEAINLTGWKIADPSNHLIIGEELVIQASEYVIIAKNSFFDNFSEYYNATANAKAGFYLKNSGEQVNLINSSESEIDSITYSSDWGADGNNNSLQFNGTDWCEGLPTPGAENACAALESVEQNQSEQNQSETNQSVEDTPSEVIVNCTGVEVVEIISYPNSTKFGCV